METLKLKAIKALLDDMEPLDLDEIDAAQVLILIQAILYAKNSASARDDI